LLEELLTNYRGTLLLVSHDRQFIDNVVTSTLVLEGDGRVGEYVGGYSDWLRQRPTTPGPFNPRRLGASSIDEGKTPVAAASSAKRKLSYKDARELQQLPARIEQLERAIAEQTSAMQAPEFFKQPAAAITAANATISELQADLDAAYARWHALES